jgi:hypothetical protein
MRQVINGKLYDQKQMLCLCSTSDYREGMYCGARLLMEARYTGQLVMVTTVDKEHPDRAPGMLLVTHDQAKHMIEGWTIGEDEIDGLLRRGLITEA